MFYDQVEINNIVCAKIISKYAAADKIREGPVQVFQLEENREKVPSANVWRRLC